MNNLEYIERKAQGSSRKFSEFAREIFAERNKHYRFDGDIIDWLKEDADIALDFPPGTLIQWDEDSSAASDPNARRKNVYGLVKDICSHRDSLRLVIVSTTNHYGTHTDMTLFMPNNNVRMADIPKEIVEIVRGSVTPDDKIREQGNRI